jgi:CheY-like chemotaxis protein
MVSSRKIALIEDDDAIRLMYKFKLEKSGYVVSEASDGREGLEVIEKSKPDLILLDLKMPIMTGDEMLQHLRETDWGANIRVIILTNVSRDEAPQSLRLLNVDRYIVKAHHTPNQVIDLIEDILGK